MTDRQRNREYNKFIKSLNKEEYQLTENEKEGIATAVFVFISILYVAAHVVMMVVG